MIVDSSSVRRSLAALLAVTLAAAPAVGPALHVHAYSGHDHPEHHHGPASHEHDAEHAAAPELDDHHDADGGQHEAIQPETCSPARHSLAIEIGCSPPPQPDLHLADFPGPAFFVRAVPARSAIAVTDLRAHGPPSDTRIPSRAPPLTHLT